jgi:hypothetical protein
MEKGDIIIEAYHSGALFTIDLFDFIPSIVLYSYALGGS